MFGTLAATAALAFAPCQGGTLNLTNARTTYGEMGAVRSDNRYMPQDFYFLAFDMEGLTVSPEGKVSYTMMVEVTNSAGQSIFKQDKPAESEEFIVLGGNRMPGRAWVSLQPNQAPGTYKCKVTVTDRPSKAVKVLEKSFDVVKKDFGMVAIMTTFDSKGEIPAPPVGVVGQILYLRGAVVGFGRGINKKPNTKIELKLYDETKRPTVAKPQSVDVPQNIPDGDDEAYIMLVIPLSREGNFTADLTATDASTGKTAKVSFPIRVLAPPK